MNYCGVIIIILLLNFCLEQSVSQIYPGRDFFLSLPDDEREDFLAFSLGDGYTKNLTQITRRIDFPFPDVLGIDEKLLEKFQKLKAPEDFNAKLFVWVRTSYNMDQESLRNLILNRNVCLNENRCVDMVDVGGLCCPF